MLGGGESNSTGESKEGGSAFDLFSTVKDQGKAKESAIPTVDIDIEDNVDEMEGLLWKGSEEVKEPEMKKPVNQLLKTESSSHARKGSAFIVDLDDEDNDDNEEPADEEKEEGREAELEAGSRRAAEVSAVEEAEEAAEKAKEAEEEAEAAEKLAEEKEAAEKAEEAKKAAEEEEAKRAEEEEAKRAEEEEAKRVEEEEAKRAEEEAKRAEARRAEEEEAKKAEEEEEARKAEEEEAKRAEEEAKRAEEEEEARRAEEEEARKAEEEEEAKKAEEEEAKRAEEEEARKAAEEEEARRAEEEEARKAEEEAKKAAEEEAQKAEEEAKKAAEEEAKKAAEEAPKKAEEVDDSRASRSSKKEEMKKKLEADARRRKEAILAYESTKRTSDASVDSDESKPEDPAQEEQEEEEPEGAAPAPNTSTLRSRPKRPGAAKGRRAPTLRNPIKDQTAGPELKTDDELTKQDEESQADTDGGAAGLPGAFRLPGIGEGGSGTLRRKGGGGGQNVLKVGDSSSFGSGVMPKFDPTKVTLRKTKTGDLSSSTDTIVKEDSSQKEEKSPFEVKLKSTPKLSHKEPEAKEVSSQKQGTFEVKLKSTSTLAPKEPMKDDQPKEEKKPVSAVAPQEKAPSANVSQVPEGERMQLQKKAHEKLTRRLEEIKSTEASNKEFNKSPKIAIEAAARNEPTFSHLDLSENTVFSMKHREYCEALGEALKSNTHLVEVKLAKCTLDAVDCKAIAAGLAVNDSVEVLHLNNNKISNDGATALAEALKTNSRLTEFNMLGQPAQFGDACLSEFIKMFKYNVTLCKIIWRLDSRKSFAINKLIVRNNTIKKWMSEGKDVSSLIPTFCNVPELKQIAPLTADDEEEKVEEAQANETKEQESEVVEKAIGSGQMSIRDRVGIFGAPSPSSQRKPASAVFNDDKKDKEVKEKEDAEKKKKMEAEKKKKMEAEKKKMEAEKKKKQEEEAEKKKKQEEEEAEKKKDQKRKEKEEEEKKAKEEEEEEERKAMALDTPESDAVESTQPASLWEEEEGEEGEGEVEEASARELPEGGDSKLEVETETVTSAAQEKRPMPPPPAQKADPAKLEEAKKHKEEQERKKKEEAEQKRKEAAEKRKQEQAKKDAELRAKKEEAEKKRQEELAKVASEAQTAQKAESVVEASQAAQLSEQEKMDLQNKAHEKLTRRLEEIKSTEASNKEFNKSPKIAIEAAARNEPTFSHLDLSENTVFSMKHREYCEALGEALKSNTHLVEVKLAKCTLDAVDCKAIAAGLAVNDSVEVLHLNNNKISNDGATALAEALKTNSRLTEFNMLGQPAQFGDACLSEFIKMFKYNVTLCKIIWRLDSRKSFAINKLIVRNNTIKKWMSEGKDVSSLIPTFCNVPELKQIAPLTADDETGSATSSPAPQRTSSPVVRSSPALMQSNDSSHSSPVVNKAVSNSNNNSNVAVKSDMDNIDSGAMADSESSSQDSLWDSESEGEPQSNTTVVSPIPSAMDIFGPRKKMSQKFATLRSKPSGMSEEITPQKNEQASQQFATLRGRPQSVNLSAQSSESLKKSPSKGASNYATVFSPFFHLSM